MNRNCSCCSGNLTFYFNKINESNSYPIYRCIKCKSAFVFPYPSDEYIIAYYNNYDYPSNNSEVDKVIEQEKSFPNTVVDAKRVINNFNNYEISSSKNLLDVACGFGWFCKEAKENNYNVVATELNEKCRKITYELSKVMPLDKLIDEKFSKEFHNKFDFVLMSQILEHLKIDNNVVSLIYNIMKPNGICCVAVPNFGSLLSFFQGKKDMFISPPEHLNFFTLIGLKNLFSKHNFEIVKFETISRYDKKKLKKKNKFIFILFPLLDIFFFISDKFSRGMYLNVYFKKNY